MSEDITIALNADGLWDLVPTTGFHSLDTSQKVDSLMEFEMLENAERFQELFSNTTTREGIDFLIRLHASEEPYNYRLEGPLLEKFMESYA
jgi:hypothetical protein